MDRRVLFFGDSFVNGFGDPEGLGWVGRVAAASAAGGMPITAYNLGVRGDTSEQVVARWRGEAERRLAPGAAFGVVFSFGANDIPEERVPHDRSKGALSTALDSAVELRLPALVVGPGPLGDERDERVETLSAAYGELCAARRVRFIPVVGALRAHAAWRGEAASHDGTHPAAAGYAELARLVIAGGWAAWLAELS